METVNPTLLFVFDLIMSIKNGIPLTTSISMALTENNDFSREMKVWWLCHQNKGTFRPKFSTDHRKILSELLENGLAGASILQNLEDLYDELGELHEVQIQGYLEKLPFRLMLPLVCFFFPSILVLLFGPLLGQIYQEVLK